MAISEITFQVKFEKRPWYKPMFYVCTILVYLGLDYKVAANIVAKTSTRIYLEKT